MLSQRFSIRNIEFQDLLEDFLVSAVVAILGIRLFLTLTGFPQLGGEGLHISHMLWGGILMFMAIGLLLTFLNNSIKRLAAIIGGIGFGTFIDEVGKFITSDNDYFYQPTFAIIYIVFILVYIVLRAYSKYKIFTPKEYLVNSLELIKDAVINDLDPEEKAKAMQYLNQADAKDTLTITLKNVYARLNTIPQPRPDIVTRNWRLLKKVYFNMVAHRWFISAISLFFIGKSALSLIDTWTFGRSFSVIFLHINLPIDSRYLHFSEFAYLFSITIAGLFVIAGVVAIMRSRLTAYRMFKRSLLVSIFLVQVFQFYRSPLAAFAGLLINITLLVTINYMIDREKEKKVSGL